MKRLDNIKFGLFVLCHIIFLVSCKRTIQKDVGIMSGQTVDFPSTMIVIDGTHTLHPSLTNKYSGAQSKMKLIVYIDSTECASCAAHKLHGWYSFLEKADEYNSKLQVCFVFSPKKTDIENLKVSLPAERFAFPVFLDVSGEFARKNDFISHQPQLHSFLTDEHNRIILIGNPLLNRKIGEMFWNKVKKHCPNEGI